MDLDVGAIQTTLPPPAPTLHVGAVQAVSFEVIVCTEGVWSSVISFSPCDDYRIVLDGPAANLIKASVNMEFEE